MYADKPAVKMLVMFGHLSLKNCETNLWCKDRQVVTQAYKNKLINLYQIDKTCTKRKLKRSRQF